MSERRIRNYGTTNYIMGNTVASVAPATATRTRVRPHNNVSTQSRTLAVSGSTLFALVLAVAVCVASCVAYLHLQASVTETKACVQTLKNDISTIKSQNEAVQYSINTFVNSENIYKVATKKLGMHQADENQIVTYKSSDGGYTVQYGNIPNN